MHDFQTSPFVFVGIMFGFLFIFAFWMGGWQVFWVGPKDEDLTD